MPLVAAHEIDPKDADIVIYNGFDSAKTLEIDHITSAISCAHAQLAYEMLLGFQAPAMEMMLRGFRVDPIEKESAIERIKKKKQRLDQILERLVTAITQKPYNPKFPNSGTQLRELFYERMNLKPIEKKNRKTGRIERPMDRNALERLGDQNFYAEPFTAAVLLHRDLTGFLEDLETLLDSDGRWRTSYNITGTTTFRWSSSKSGLGSGGNLQNITEVNRRMFIADKKRKLCGIDAEQSEARDVGWFCGTQLNKWNYLNTVEAGDCHTRVARMCWPDLAWTGDMQKDRQIADMVFYRHHTRRDTTKRLAHGCLTEDHEVLTRTGWTSIGQKPTEILQFHPTQGKSFAKVENWVDKLWEGNFYVWEGPLISIKMTHYHTVYYNTPEDPVLMRDIPQYVPDNAGIPNGYTYINLETAHRSVSYENLRVLCPTVPSGMFFVKRNGKVSVTGNSNYMGKPVTMSAQTKIPLYIVKPFQERYFDSFPEIPEMHRWHAEKLQRDRYIVNCFGLRRDFFDRPESDETLRSAVANSFQSATGLRVNLGGWRMWKYMGPRIELLAQLHDANYFQYHLDDDEDDLIKTALNHMKVMHYHKLPDGTLREFTVPNEAQVGFNWAHRWKLRDDGTKEDWNPTGLDKWRG